MSFILASVVATLSPIPLGLGSFEGTCTGLLHLMGGRLEASLAATLILRGFTLWIPMLPGLWVIRREAMKPAIDTGVAGARGYVQLGIPKRHPLFEPTSRNPCDCGGTNIESREEGSEVENAFVDI